MIPGRNRYNSSRNSAPLSRRPFSFSYLFIVEVVLIADWLAVDDCSHRWPADNQTKQARYGLVPRRNVVHAMLLDDERFHLLSACCFVVSWCTKSCNGTFTMKLMVDPALCRSTSCPSQGFIRTPWSARQVTNSEKIHRGTSGMFIETLVVTIDHSNVLSPDLHRLYGDEWHATEMEGSFGLG